ncbi:MAG: DUF1573 domain-containing protein [Aureispira sp.]|nr:DUF1573 domain-containing protein [Aureispira sp.]
MLFLMGCGEPAPDINKDVPNVDEVENASGIPNSQLIHSPITADRAIDETEAAKFEFEEQSFDFGAIAEGEQVEHLFKFKNVGKSPLIINHAQGSCGCTIPEWPREPIAPGAEGEIKVKFNSKDKSGHQEKLVTLTANTYPNKTELRIIGNVE